MNIKSLKVFHVRKKMFILFIILKNDFDLYQFDLGASNTSLLFF